MKEQLISFETAKLAKEKGFDVPALKGYCNEGELLWIDALDEGDILLGYASTQSLLQKWLREEHGIDVIASRFWTDPYPYGYNYWTKKLGKWKGAGIHNKFETYEEALEKGLKKALELIK